MLGPPEDKDPDSSLITDLRSTHRHLHSSRKIAGDRKDSLSNGDAETESETTARASQLFCSPGHPTGPFAWDVEWFIMESIS